MHLDLAFFVNRRPLNPKARMLLFPLLYVPNSLARINGIFKTFYNGYRVVFSAIRNLLSRSEAIPTAANVRQEILEYSGFMKQRNYRFFVEHNGGVEFALACILRYAYITRGKALGSKGCKNDSDFRTVAHMLRLPGNPEYGNKDEDSQVDEGSEVGENNQPDEDNKLDEHDQPDEDNQPDEDSRVDEDDQEYVNEDD